VVEVVSEQDPHNSQEERLFVDGVQISFFWLNSKEILQNA